MTLARMRREVEKQLNPYQGLKPTVQGNHKLTWVEKQLNPYQGLKLDSTSWLGTLIPS